MFLSPSYFGYDNSRKYKLRKLIAQYKASGRDDGILETLTDNTGLKNKFLILKKGYELLPSRSRYDKKKQTRVPDSFHKVHMNILSRLLHTSMLRNQWYNAYKIYFVYIKLYIAQPKSVDFELLWPIGLHIVSKLDELKLRQTLPENLIPHSTISLCIQGKITDESIISKQRELLLDRKSEKFLQWLVKFSVQTKTKQNNYTLISTTYLWHKVVALTMYEKLNCDFKFMDLGFKKVTDLIEDFILQNTFNSSANYEYIYLIHVLCQLEYYKLNNKLENIQKLQEKFKQLTRKLDEEPWFVYDSLKVEKKYKGLFINDFNEDLSSNNSDPLSDCSDKEDKNLGLQESDEESNLAESPLDRDSEEEKSSEESQEEVEDFFSQSRYSFDMFG